MGYIFCIFVICDQACIIDIKINFSGVIFKYNETTYIENYSLYIKKKFNVVTNIVIINLAHIFTIIHLCIKNKYKFKLQEITVLKRKVEEYEKEKDQLKAKIVEYQTNLTSRITNKPITKIVQNKVRICPLKYKYIIYVYYIYIIIDQRS